MDSNPRRSRLRYPSPLIRMRCVSPPSSLSSLFRINYTGPGSNKFNKGRNQAADHAVYFRAPEAGGGPEDPPETRVQLRNGPPPLPSPPLRFLIIINLDLDKPARTETLLAKCAQEGGEGGGEEGRRGGLSVHKHVPRVTAMLSSLRVRACGYGIRRANKFLPPSPSPPPTLSFFPNSKDFALRGESWGSGLDLRSRLVV